MSEKFFALCDLFGAANVGMMTGDATVNPTAPIICGTAEILANQALRQGAAADVGQVVMDEFHYYADPQRGWAWQVPLLELTTTQFVLMSATLGDITGLELDLSERTGRSTAVITSVERPVPLPFSSVPCRCTRRSRNCSRSAGAHLRRAFHPGLSGRAGAGTDEHQRRVPRGEGRRSPS